jgi:hypothetical protein
MHKYAAATALVIALNITMLAPAVPLYTDGVWPCGGNHVLGVPAGRPCVFLVGPPAPSAAASPPGGLGMGMMSSAEIIESPHNGTAVLRADRRSGYYYPKPGFTGKDCLRVRSTGCNFFGTWHASAFNNWCGSTTRTICINVLPDSYPSPVP